MSIIVWCSAVVMVSMVAAKEASIGVGGVESVGVVTITVVACL
jgi:hypothetical protein